VKARLNRRQSRILALLLFLMVLVLAVAAIALPALAMNRHYDQLISGMNNQLEVYQRVARHGEQYQMQYQQLQRSQRRDRRYLQSESESLATAELQRIAKQSISGNKGEILSTQVMRMTEEEGFNRVAVRIRMKSALDDMVKIFHALETRKPYLFVENVNVRSRNVKRRRKPSTKAIEDAIALLDIDFYLSGYMRGERQ
jgi:general secretion pathway protein M